MGFVKYIIIAGFLILTGVPGNSESYYSGSDSKSEAIVDLFPNPASTSATITISAEKEINKIQLLNILGEQILVEDTEPSTSVNFDLGQLKNGIYIVKVTFSDKTSSTKRLWVK
jgi:hypothetical protein